MKFQLVSDLHLSCYSEKEEKKFLNSLFEDSPADIICIAGDLTTTNAAKVTLQHLREAVDKKK